MNKKTEQRYSLYIYIARTRLFFSEMTSRRIAAFLLDTVAYRKLVFLSLQRLNAADSAAFYKGQSV